MSTFNNYVYNFIRVKNDDLKEVNDRTRKIWNEAISDENKDIIEITKKGSKYKEYLVDTSVYFNLIQASKEVEGNDPYGTPNVNFTLIERTDDRWGEFYEQRMQRGFDDSETWSLYSTFTSFILPRLKRFKELEVGYPSSMSKAKWEKILSDMIMAFEYLDDEDLGIDDERSFSECIDERNKIIDKGLKLFIKHYCKLWW